MPDLTTRAEARAAGLKTYFTGKPCSYGHVAPRRTDTARCSVCQQRSNKKWTHENQERYTAVCRQANKRWYRENKDYYLTKRRAERLERPDDFKEYWREWYHKNSERLKDGVRVRNHRRRIAGGSFTVADIKRLLKYQQGKCAYCRCKLKKYHVDHIVPVAKGGTHDPSNLQICCQGCNQRKADKMPEIFAREIGLLI